MKRILIALLALSLMGASTFAATVAASATPDASSNPVLSDIQKSGAKLYYMGRRLGLDGWFIVKDGQVQIVYATPDNKGAVVGALFGEDGENVTTLQVSTLVGNNTEVAALVAGAAKEQDEIAHVGSPPAAAMQAIPSTGIPSASLSAGERLIRDLSTAATVVVGNASAPELLMVMDPHCAHCQATWKALREEVFKGKLHIRMVPIGTTDTDNERAAAVLLGASDPLNAWDKYVSGDKGQLVGAASAPALAAVRSNHALIDSWSIQQTPYLVYRGKDGKVKVVQGEPDKVSVVLTDLGL